jgi:tetratricopeptide (TPR) repeat protein
VNNRLKLLLLALLVQIPYGFGQQDTSTKLTRLLTAAQEAQAVKDYAAAADDYRQAVKIQPALAELWANLGLMQQEINDLSGAMQSFQHANHLNPSLYVPNLFLGIDYVRTGRAKEAIPLLLRAQKSNGADPQVPLALGRAYLVLGKFQSATQTLTRALHSDPKLSSAWFSLGIAELDQVEEEARKMTSEDPESTYVQALYAESLERQSRYREATEIFSKIIDSQPQPPCMHSELGYSLVRHHDNLAAQAEFSAERKANPGCGLAILGQARMAVVEGKSDEVLALFQELWRRDHGFVLANIALLRDGLTSETVGNWEKFLVQRRDTLAPDLYVTMNGTAQNAILKPAAGPAATIVHTAEDYYAAGQYQLCAQRLRHSPTEGHPDKLQLLATCSFLTGDYERAAAAAAALTTLQPHSMPAHYWSVKSHERLAFAALDRFQELEPNSARSHILLGDIYRQRERYDDAVKEYKRALDIAPDDPAAMLGLAAAYLSNNDTGSAIETARPVLARIPNDPELNLLMAEALIAKHDFAEAKPYLDKSLHAKPQMLPHVHALLGQVYAETGKTQEAISELKLGEMSDEDGSVHYQLARLYRQTGDNKSAAEAIEKTKAIKQQRRLQRPIAIEDPDFATPQAGP